MTDTPRDKHPRLDLADPYGDDVNDKIRAAIEASPTDAVRVYYPGDTDATADVVKLADDGLLTTWTYTP